MSEIVESRQITSPMALDVLTIALKSAFASCLGLSEFEGVKTAHFAAAVDLTAWGSAAQALGLPLVTSVSNGKTQINADGADSTLIVCADPRILADTQIEYFVDIDDAVDLEATLAPVTAGRVELELSAAVAGNYRVRLKRVGSLETAVISIKAV